MTNSPQSCSAATEHEALAVRVSHMSKWFTDQSYEATTLRAVAKALRTHAPTQPWSRPLATISEEEIDRVAQAIERTMFAPHELPLTAELHLKYRATAISAISAIPMPNVAQRQQEPTIEKTPSDAPAWYKFDEACAWASGFNAALAAHTPATPVETKSASEMIAACYEGLCPDGSSALDFEWARQRGYILPNNGSGKLSPAQCSAETSGQED